MNETRELIEKLIKLMGFEDVSVTYIEDSNRYLVFVNDGLFLKRFLAQLINDLEFLVKMILLKKGLGIVYIDINNYRKDREELIIKLAKAAAKKASTIKQEVSLPAMNAYERRIVHSQLTMHPDLKTESIGEGKQRHVIIKPI
ncbi:MAG TPA: R3H domain-containing nucleic acid-binding protein [Candidatus Paceibacterota bacterium]|nr:R3H domain-containing nucleic acid-binding protein [Candidatus Paceibacterota bacterium]